MKCSVSRMETLDVLIKFGAKITKKIYNKSFFTIFIAIFYAEAAFAVAKASFCPSFFLAVLLMLSMMPT